MNKNINAIKIKYFNIVILACVCLSFRADTGIADPSYYLDDIKTELQKQWPKNRTINLVFHGHSVPAGFHKTPLVKPFSSYPLMLLEELKEIYPYAVINIINTAIGGENSISGVARFEDEVLIHQADVLFIDYSLNDRGAGLEKARVAWSSMIGKAVQDSIKVILLTPSPDTRTENFTPDCELTKHADQVRRLAEEFSVGLVDSYGLFEQQVMKGDSLWNYMSQINHPNKQGHQLIVDGIMKYFK